MPSSIVTTGIYTNATLYPSNKTDPARKKSALDVTVKVSDGSVMERAQGADHFERVKIGVPFMEKGHVAWKEVSAHYDGQGIAGYYQRELVDYHSIHLSGVNADLVKKQGVYVKLEYGDGSTVVWGQEFGKNHKPDAVR